MRPESLAHFSLILPWHYHEEVTMNAIQLLKSEHEKAKSMFAQIEGAAPEQRRELWTKLAPELKMHEQMEETALYGPVAQEAGSKDRKLQEWKDHHHEEVSEAESLIAEIGGLDPTDEDWMDNVQELRQTLEHHIQEEESDIWPRIQQVWDASRLERAGEQMEGIRRQKTPRAA